MFVCKACRVAAAHARIQKTRWQSHMRAPISLASRKLSILANLKSTSTSSTHRDEADDEHISEAINNPPRHSKPSFLFRPLHQPTGLFGYTFLTHPNELVVSAQHTLRLAQRIVDLVCSATTESELKRTVKRLDRLSDLICSVVDGAEVVKNIHPDSRWVHAAKEAHLVLSDYLNQLNTHTGLYQVLKRTVETPSITSQWDEQEMQVARLLLADFEKSGIHLPQIVRDKVVTLHNRILSVGQDFVMGAGPATPGVVIRDAQNALQGLPPDILESCLIDNKKKLAILGSSRYAGSNRGGGGGSATAMIPMGSPAVNAVLRFCRNEDVRKRVYEASNSGTDAQVALLDDLLQTRAELAHVLGVSSYACLHLSDKMAQTPEHVMSFLNDLASAYRPLAESKIQQLRDIKKHHSTSNTSDIYAWDRLFYSQFTSSPDTMSPSPPSHDPFHPNSTPIHPHESNMMDSTSAYLTPGGAFKGIAYLFRLLYGVRLQVTPTLPGETWHPDVVRLDVIDEGGVVLGTIYCDLYEREVGGGRKYESAAHFTVRGSRRIDGDFEESDDYLMSSHSNGTSGGDKQHILSRPQGISEVDGKKYQIPVVVLVTSFQRPQGHNKPSLLSLGECETLFHEMGHALHSMLARTDYQHIAGTRCSVDFVEIPSMFHERFARHPVILSYIGRHHKTRQPLPPHLLASISQSASYTNPLDGLSQIQAAALDQAYHSELVLQPGFSSDGMAKAIHEKYNHNLVGFVDGTRWHAQFSHLYSYGASYYAYFWSKRWAERIYERLFSVDGKSGSSSSVEDVWRRGGQVFWKELLAPGGGRDPYIGLRKIGLEEEEHTASSTRKNSFVK
ncbi:hypothetical protein SmJEL517_g06144 [Synchytrium microbalum]|uniref:mitochondrial intermediate peptidase n=1 Tax=Synchytrium microbalum TaxID=1806994 RepID=A0A507BWQ5_9FUNG|nr:uncharacterized protein SmJEL517_g06144 [Synchytrium microbalum]TPX30254.1 hypothetical protein SmJEL517_g06144 [Synchytrium microbalum]